MVDKLHFGDSWKGVVNTLVIFEDGNVLGTTVDRPSKQVLIKGLQGNIPSGVFVVVAAKIVQVQPLLICEIGDGSLCCQMPPCSSHHLDAVVELCSGAGFFSSMAGHVDLHTVLGVDMNPRWASLFTTLHEDAEFMVGSCGDEHVVKAMLNKGIVHPVLLAGIACQPYSRAGDGRGMNDCRAQSLPQTLQTAWCVQAPIVVLECVPEIQQNEEVQSMLRAFVASTGYCMTQQILRLSNAWCAKRDRWFAILSFPALGEIHVPDLPQLDQYRVIGNILPYPLPVVENALAQLQLSLYELSSYHDFAHGGMEKALINFQGILPTCLHSAGNQVYPCRCGCHKGLSLERIRTRGLFGTLIGLGNYILHNGYRMQQCRFMHPDEVFLMHGGVVPHDWGNDLRLALAALGQGVAPLQALWILSHVKGRLQLFQQQAVVNPLEKLEKHIDEVIRARDHSFQHPQKLMVSQDDCKEIQVSDVKAGVTLVVRVSPNATVHQVLAAEIRLQCHLVGCLDVDGKVAELSVFDTHGQSIQHDQRASQFDVLIVGFPVQSVTKEVLPCPCVDWPEEKTKVVSVSPTLPFEVNAPTAATCAFEGCRGKSFLEFKCPQVNGKEAIDHLTNPTMPAVSRLEVLTRQGETMADDEMRFHLRHIATASPEEQKVVSWDPLLLTAIASHSSLDSLSRVIGELCDDATVITALVVDHHWVPVIWRFTKGQTWAFTCGQSFGYNLAVNRIHAQICSLKGCDQSRVTYHKIAFECLSCCGAMALMYIEHLIWGSEMPTSMHQLKLSHVKKRDQFGALNQPLVSRPWVWGLGDGSLASYLKQLLIEHGVLSSEADQRTQLMIDKIGERPLTNAIKSATPWKEVKWLASHCVPPFQIVKPSELQSAIEARSKDGKPVGNRAQKRGKGKGKGKTFADRKVVDPHVLRLENGIFECGSNIPLQQIKMSDVGHSASGIVLCTSEEAAPFLKDGRPISSGGLALIVVDQVVTQVASSLLAEHVRFPVMCVANAEPALIDGLLYQLGAQKVFRRIAANKFELVSISTCVIKFMIFKDQVDVSWETICAHPLKHLMARVSLLQVCRDDQCVGECPAWHCPKDSSLEDPILEVWGKQWLSHAFVATTAEQADAFVVHVRMPSQVQSAIQSASGVAGIYLEPKEVDGKQPSSSYQVFWLPKASFRDLVHMKQVTPGIVGIARLGLKFGVRCEIGNAEAVHAAIRPGSSYLPQGKKLHFLIGPMPFGTLKSSVAQILEMLNWAARPMHPIAAAAHVNGVMWKLQAVDPPPQLVIQTDHGELLVTRLNEPTKATSHRPSVVGASQTLSLITADRSGAIDPLQLHDPWEQSIKKGVASSAGPSVQASDPVKELEDRVIAAVIAKMPKDSMEIDSDGTDAAVASKVSVLEKQVQELHGTQTKFQAMVCEQSQAQQAQISVLQNQSTKLESAINDNATKLGAFQVQFQHQLEKQQGQLDSLFQQQMDRIEDLFQKKARTS